MMQTVTAEHERYPDPHHDTYSKTIFGFWAFLVTDFMVFATLFASFAVLYDSSFGGPKTREFIHLPWSLLQSIILLGASFTAGLGGAAAHRRNKQATLLFFALTFVLGACFVWMEWAELAELVRIGSDWKQSALLSIYFSIEGTFLLHVFFALLWIIVLLPPVIGHGITSVSIKRLTCLRMFWQFMNIVWIFIFSVVDLIGVLL